MKNSRLNSIKELMVIPGVGKSTANDLVSIGINSVADLIEKNPEQLYDDLCVFSGSKQDRCVLYVFRCAVYYAETPIEKQDPEKLKWWNWKD
ncbi:MAG: helix-hairpin-helix domain-containing protein [bacterium]